MAVSLLHLGLWAIQHALATPAAFNALGTELETLENHELGRTGVETLHDDVDVPQ
ncbi:hypothetical protein [Rhodoferax ferrireducens]|uniref:hypothetical protein n=1 Tax=Rhodoferax ferrireducens TaxID=192843 RepID=UPI0013004B53|nr:hypothetical protein [Rhodoferax ferrireducens]